MITDRELDALIRSTYSAMTVPDLAPRTRARPVLRLALVAAVLALLFAAIQVEPVRSATGAAIERFVLRSTRSQVVEPTPTPTASPGPTPASPRAAEVLFRARQVLAQSTAGKARFTHEGAPFGINRDFVLQRGTSWVATVRSQCPDRSESLTVSSATGLYEQRIVIGNTVYVRTSPDGAWVTFTATSSPEPCTSADAELVIGQGAYADLRDRGQLGPNAQCGTVECYTHVTTDVPAFDPDRVVGSSRVTLLIEVVSGRFVERRVHVDWPNGRTTDEVTEFFDHDMPNVIEAPVQGR